MIIPIASQKCTATLVRVIMFWACLRLLVYWWQSQVFNDCNSYCTPIYFLMHLWSSFFSPKSVKQVSVNPVRKFKWLPTLWLGKFLITRNFPSHKVGYHLNLQTGYTDTCFTHLGEKKNFSSFLSTSLNMWLSGSDKKLTIMSTTSSICGSLRALVLNTT